MTPRSKSKLSIKQRQLIELMQYINFGRINNLTVKDGEPELTHETIVERDIKLGGSANGARPESGHDDFLLKEAVVALLKELAELGTGTVKQLEIKHGLPFLIRIEERAV